MSTCETCGYVGDDVREYRRVTPYRMAFGCRDDRACFERWRALVRLTAGDAE